MTQASLRYFNCSRKTVIKSFLLQELQYAAAIVSFNIHCRVNHPHSLQSSLMPKFKITSDWIISSIKSETCSLHVKILYLQIPPSQNPQVWWSWESTGLINPELRTLNPKDVLEEPQRSLKSFPPLVGFHSPIRLFSQWLLNSCWQIYKSSNSPETETFFLEPGQRDDIKPFVKRVSGERLPPLWINEPSRKKNKKKHTHREKKKKTRSPPGLEPPPNTKLVSTSLKSRFVSPLMLRTSWSCQVVEIRGNLFESYARIRWVVPLVKLRHVDFLEKYHKNWFRHFCRFNLPSKLFSPIFKKPDLLRVPCPLHRILVKKNPNIYSPQSHPSSEVGSNLSV